MPLLVMVGEDRLQRWGNFQRLIIMLHSPRVRIIKHRIRNQWPPDRENLLFLPRGRQEIFAAAIVPGTAECLVHGDNFLNGNPGRLGGPHASWLQMSSGRWPRYDVPHDRRPSVRGGAGRRRPAPPRRSRRRKRAAPAAAHRGAAQDRGRVRWAPWRRFTMGLAARLAPAWRDATLLVQPATSSAGTAQASACSGDDALGRRVDPQQRGHR